MEKAILTLNLEYAVVLFRFFTQTYTIRFDIESVEKFRQVFDPHYGMEEVSTGFRTVEDLVYSSSNELEEAHFSDLVEKFLPYEDFILEMITEVNETYERIRDE